MKKNKLWIYVIAVIVVLVMANGIAFTLGGRDKLANMEIFSFGYLIGMTSMFIAIHFYKWK
jgi:hypothetical protein